MSTVANIFRIPELRRRILFTLGMLAVYRIGEIRFRQIGTETEGVWVRPGAVERQSFADVRGTSVRGRVRGAERRRAEPEEIDE